jgi:hypothetical protein
LWVPAELVNREVDRRIKEDAERMAQLREELKDGGKK